MLNILKTVRRAAAAKVGAVPSRKSAKLRPELIRLRFEIECIQCVIDAARDHLEQAVDPTLIDCYVYELNAVQPRYQFLLRKFKSQEDQYSRHTPQNN